MEDRKKKEVESLCEKLSVERKLLEDQRKRFKMDKWKEEEEYIKMHEQFQRLVNIMYTGRKVAGFDIDIIYI